MNVRVTRPAAAAVVWIMIAMLLLTSFSQYAEALSIDGTLLSQQAGSQIKENVNPVIQNGDLAEVTQQDQESSASESRISGGDDLHIDPAGVSSNDSGAADGSSDEEDESLIRMTVGDWNIGSTSYMALAAAGGTVDGGHSNHPPTSVTGSADFGNPILYSIDAAQVSITGVPDVVYTVTNKGTGKTITVTTGQGLALTLPKMEKGTYTIEQTSVPAGYVVTPQKREFQIDENGQGHPGIFYLYREGDYGADKTGYVIDYINRIYQIQLNARSGKYSYEVDPINLLMVVDQSNSMLFPQQLTAVSGAAVQLYRTGKDDNYYYSRTNDDRLNDLVNRGILNKGTTYYLVADNDAANYNTATSSVYAIFWNGSGWCYQDASWYSKAYRHWVLGEEHNVQDTITDSSGTHVGYVQFARSDESYNKNLAHGGSISKELSDSFAKNSELGKSGNNSKVYQLYTGSEFNRLHELQKAVVMLAGLIGSMNSQSTMTIETFASDVYSCQKYSLNNQGIVQILNAVNNITTLGGTRQDLALRHLYGDYQTGENDTSDVGKRTSNHKYNHLSNQDDYVILITDGAPNSSNGSSTIDNVKTAASTMKTRYMSGNDRLITVGLGSGNVGGDMLPTAASEPSSTYYKRVEESGALTDYFMDLFVKELAKNKKEVSSKADIVDVVSDSFYITDKDGNALSAGQRIDLNGNPDAKGPGLICYGPIDGEDQWYVTWDDQVLDTKKTTTVYEYTDGYGSKQTIDPSVIYYVNYGSGQCSIYGSGAFDSSKDKLLYDTSEGKWIYRWRDLNGDTNRRGDVGNRVTSTTKEGSVWSGRLYLKAKEDFIGGNTIDTNKQAVITLDNEDGPAKISMPTPTVNVRLLEMKGFESEETVFLGDQVEKLREKIQTLLDKTVIEKIKKGGGNQLNYKQGATEANGCYEDYFTTSYAIGRQLTDQEWNTLISGGDVFIEYTYDDDSSHGAVGYFKLSLKKDIVEGETSDYGDHKTLVSGKDIEKYTLTVQYTAYGIGQHESSGHQRKENVHNGTGSPGTEVGTGSDIPHGAGSETVRELHHIHVVDGEIILTKVIDDSLKSDQDQIYTFELYEADPTGENPSGKALQTVDVVVKAGESQGSTVVTPLARNHYLIEEKASDDYSVQKTQVITTDTSCVYTTYTTSLEFDIGTNVNSSGVDHNVILYNKDLPTYEQSVWAENMRYVYSKPFEKVSAQTAAKLSVGHGEITNAKTIYKAEIPVVKKWSDQGIHENDTVYVVLYNSTGDPVNDENGNAQMLKLNTANEWKGSFTVTVPSKNYNPLDDGCQIREVSTLSKDQFEGSIPAVLVNDDTDTEVRYVQTVQENGVIKMDDGNSYNVHYENSSGDSLVVINKKSYNFPETGGLGASGYAIGGLALFITAFVLYGFLLWRRKGRRES